MHDEHDHDHHHGADESGNPWPDRINEAYYGKMGEDFGARTRERINWMAANAAGKTALDVGCSQGITSILMAREGLRVVGIDIDPPTVRYAQAEREKEIPSVRERLEFRCCELAALGDETFDTVVLGEVIEHQTNAVRFIRDAVRHVAPNGRVVITVPFGLHPFPDHKCTVFPGDVVEAIGDAFALVSLDVTGGYVRAVAERRAGAASTHDLVVDTTEKGTIEAQQKYFAVAAREAAANKATAAANAQLTALRTEHRKMEAAVAEAAAKAAQATEKLATQSKTLIETGHAQEADRLEIARLTDQLEQRRRAFEDAGSALLATERKVGALEIELEKAKLARATLEGETKQARAAADAEVQKAQTATKSEVAKADALRRSLEDAHAMRTAHYANLETERERTKKLTELAQRLHEDNQRFQQSLALALGQAILAMRTPKGLLRFPRTMAGIARRAMRRSREGVVLQPLELPKVAPAVAVPKGGAKAKAAAASNKDARAAANALSIVGWSDHLKPGAIRVMSVMDEFSRACFAPHAGLIEPRPDNWSALLDVAKPRMVFVESAWKGNHGTWQYRVAKYANPPGRELPLLLEECRARGIPTVFWNKEDPVHFDNFIDSAQHFDIVLTTASEAIPRYRERGVRKADALQFAAEESLHNPIGSAKRNGRVCFAGSWYHNRAHREDDQRMLFDAAAQAGFDIYDRNHNPANPSTIFAFPEEYAQFVRGRLPYAEMNRAYREYSVFLNVNSVVDSPTMFSRRVFELMACGTPVVSTWARGQEETFGNDLVWHVRTREEAEHAIRTLLEDPREWRRRSLAGIRAVLSAHTFRHRWNHVLDLAGLLGEQAADPLERVLVVAEATDQRQADAIVDAFDRQAMDAGVARRLLLAVRGDARPTRTAEGVDLVEGADDDLAALLARAPAEARTGAIALMSPDVVYGRHHLQDLLHAARYSEAAVVGKPHSLARDAEYTFDVPLAPGSLLFKPGLLPGTGDARGLLRGDLTSLRGRHRLYAADSANYAASPTQEQQARESLLREVEV